MATLQTPGRLPDFLIVGAPKAGTTALHAALTQHPQLAMSAVKEPKYFLCGDVPPPLFTGPGDAHSRREWIWRRDDYRDLFPDPTAEVLSGESTPLYLADADARRRIAATIPHARLICVLRDPARTALDSARVCQPSATKGRVLSPGIALTAPDRTPRNSQTRSSVWPGASTTSR